ncbi:MULTISPECIES: hypothetical protein [unclassified Mesorhizobium]|uniref:hypothetical protein n=1 Tax=unclassified Mesorhizobium TaxID=325217 RepID=UPI001CCE6EB1|nr:MULTISPECIES: hypothetical protein [unclassified Mesorhizobium]MBZ9701696.1 hypothetical protein [Mesorhizobium sp. CO1-1-3]MBZ9949044.1 hypothetical protein [Mesorhizobium sp. BR1-1-11]
MATKAREGVEVRVLVDWVGSLPFDEDLIEIMTSAGVRFQRYRPIHWYTLDRVNNRTHRKLLTVDLYGPSFRAEGKRLLGRCSIAQR